jgi:hypothetical protein
MSACGAVMDHTACHVTCHGVAAHLSAMCMDTVELLPVLLEQLAEEGVNRLERCGHLTE